MSRINFQQKLGELKERLLVMAGLVEQGIQRSTEAYLSKDLQLCELVLQSEPAINRMEREIDRFALDLLATEQPLAGDLRLVLAVIRIKSDLERVGDQAVSIVSRVKELATLPSAEIPVDIPRLAKVSVAMIRNALQAFLVGDAALAQSVLMADDEVDDLNRQTFSTLATVIQEQPHLTPQAFNTLVISRSLERVGDHATNIAEDVIFWVHGDDVRHQGSPSA
ncbi:phosphate signaling complex protein PhoU [Terriglobus aquaticus]|uniref:Phosphate-specific transport system accessory protein PhoU n=1 Tax=Terriglobus aquaticus TaxID=940139 RepID=A0ABW9KHY0_9BACT|nr:phosphate signaling complex protein PhoU [Terriglobus aquaticus]